MKTVEDVCVDSCAEVCIDRKKKGLPFDHQSFFAGYLYAIRDITYGRLPQVMCETAMRNLQKLIKSKRKKP